MLFVLQRQYFVIVILHQVFYTCSHSKCWSFVYIRIWPNLWFSHFPFYHFYGKAQRCKELGPIGPMHLLSLGRCLHSSILVSCICKMEITRVTTALEKRMTFQEFWLGREKKELYSFEKATITDPGQVAAKGAWGDGSHLILVSHNVKGGEGWRLLHLQA